MMTELSDPTVDNEKTYGDLLTAIQASQGKLSVILAVCDDIHFRNQLIERYESELATSMRSHRVILVKDDPNLSRAITELVQTDDDLRQGGNAVVTATGAEQLLWLKFDAQHSEQEIFFASLPETQDALSALACPLVLWLTHQLESQLSQNAPEFQNWCQAVFRFHSQKTTAIPIQNIEPFRHLIEESDAWDQNVSVFPVADLNALIEYTKAKRGVNDPNLATLYAQVGHLYQRRLEQGESLNYPQEQALAVEYLSQAIQLKKELGQETSLAETVNNLAELYRLQGCYREAEPLYLEALELRKSLLGDAHPDVATSLNNLAKLYQAQGQYAEAEPLYLQALDLRKR